MVSNACLASMHAPELCKVVIVSNYSCLVYCIVRPLCMPCGNGTMANMLKMLPFNWCKLAESLAHYAQQTEYVGAHIARHLRDTNTSSNPGTYTITMPNTKRFVILGTFKNCSYVTLCEHRHTHTHKASGAIQTLVRFSRESRLKKVR